ncbi:MAG: hypothetical protein SW833_07260 [Cyanobacteriota bacterium]|nr:hypothetical protein [Cyanobacteriota bacterium]
MTPNPTLLKSVEQLDYRVTAGDVAAQAGLEVNFAQSGLLALAADAGGHLQVADSGDVVYLFPKNFRTILRNKSWRMQLQEGWQKVWRVLFYLIRISFGTILILSILLMLAAIAAIFIYINSTQDDRDDNRSGGGGGFVFLPRLWGPNVFWWFDPGYGYSTRPRRQRQPSGDNSQPQMSFLEAVFSFLFGDGNPNADLEERRWQTIGTAIRNNGGAVAAEQVAPYLDEVDIRDNEDYMLPVLVRFNGYLHVSDEGQIVYTFPELQVTARDVNPQPISPYLEEQRWRFSAASTGQILLAIGLGSLNIILALVLYALLNDPANAPQIAQLGGVVGLASSMYGLLLGYGIAFLTIPLVRHFWIQWRNSIIEGRNQQRLARAQMLRNADASLQRKIAYAHQFASQNQIGEGDLAYTTQTDLLEQNLQNSDRIDQEWQQRLESGSPPLE